MPDGPLVTFAVTCYNQADVIGKAIAGALAQDYIPLEIIVSDDASTDGSIAEIERALAGYSGPHTVRINRNERNLGIAGQYDRLSEIATGDLVICADGDDISLPQRARRFAESWRASGDGPVLLHGPCQMLDAQGRDRKVVYPPAETRNTPPPMGFIEDYLYVIGANFAWSKDFYRVFGPMARHALIDDHVLPFRAALIGTIVYVDEPLVRKYPGGMANLAVAQTGHDLLFGLFLKELPWKIGDYRQFEADLAHTGRPDREVLLAAARRRREFHEMQLRMARAAPLRRLAMLPAELVAGLRRRDRAWLRSALLYAGTPLTTMLLDRRLRHARSERG